MPSFNPSSNSIRLTCSLPEPAMISCTAGFLLDELLQLPFHELVYVNISFVRGPNCVNVIELMPKACKAASPAMAGSAHSAWSGVQPHTSSFLSLVRPLSSVSTKHKGARWLVSTLQYADILAGKETCILHCRGAGTP